MQQQSANWLDKALFPCNNAVFNPPNPCVNEFCTPKKPLFIVLFNANVASHIPLLTASNFLSIVAKSVAKT